MDLENAIEVHNVTKKFKVFMDKGRTLKELTLFSNRRKYEEREVLKNISFEVKRGEAVGLIGHNGCGKSTTLKLLTKIMYPDQGSIEMRGRVSSLIELGAGFHPDMSGRENIYTNASIFGLTRRDIDKRLNDIIEFSELQKYIDNPVRTYSSGMYMRLAFSVAINVDADILLIDEILAVGDANFQTKCFEKLRGIKANGTTVVIVSHSLGQIEQICDRSLWINDGQVVAEGKPTDVHIQYMVYMGEKRVEANEEHKKALPKEQKQGEKDDNEWGNFEVEIKDAFIVNRKGERVKLVSSEEELAVELHYKVHKPQPEGYNIGVGFYNMDHEMVFGTNTKRDMLKIPVLTDNAVIRLHFPQINLKAGKYYLHTSIIDQYDTPLDFYKYYDDFEVITTDTSAGMFILERDWEVNL